MTEKFDASRYVVKLRGKEYLEVKWRLLWFRTQHPDGTIRTELVEHDRAGKFAVFRAEVVIPGAGSATGWGQEEAADFGDYLEKAETKALGRALAALGFGTQFTEDFEFGAEDGRLIDSPAARGGHLVDEAKRHGATEIERRPLPPEIADAPQRPAGGNDGVIRGREEFLRHREQQRQAQATRQ